ncbi:MAG TPA: shikimate kinase [Candidatus Polarisedimenticolaceae bacterium]|nr:shikimate kinase [Candidatus Polarisedimenticolaceae bacterium]
MSDRAIYLVGFMAAGKSTVGRALAHDLGWEFADTDAIVERERGTTIETIFRTEGEGAFREAEWRALLSLEGRSRLVVATGGGLFLGAPHRAFIRANGVSCWLDLPLEVARARVDDPSSRPLLALADALDRRAFFERRRAAYALADVHVDASSGTASEVARAVDARRRSFLY